MLKMSEITPATNAVLANLLGEIFSEDEVALVGEELHDHGVFTALPFDHLVFTGAPAIGRIVMRTAADNLTPVDAGARRQIAGGGHAPLSAGRRGTTRRPRQSYQLRAGLHLSRLRAGARERMDEFVAHVMASFTAMFSDSVGGNADYTGW